MTLSDRTIWFAFLVVVLVGGVLVGTKGKRMPDSNETEYRSEVIKLSDSYSDYDEFKNDPNNLAPDETERVQRLVSTATIPQSFTSREAMIHEVFNVKFPGYGLSLYGTECPDGARIEGFSIEIPRRRRIDT